MRAPYIASVALAVLTLATAPAHAQNLVQNGDFSLGNTGFSSDYTPVATNGTVYTTPPAFAVVSNPATAFTNGYLSYGDHTSGSGQMLFFDGAGSALDVWRQSVALDANTQYIFDYYASTPDGGQLSGNDLVNLQTRVNGSALGNTIITGQGSAWQLVSTSFTTTNAGLYTLAITDLNNTASLNDGLIDDISLQAVSSGAVPEPGTWALVIAGFGMMGGVARRRPLQKALT